MQTEKDSIKGAAVELTEVQEPSSGTLTYSKLEIFNYLHRKRRLKQQNFPTNQVDFY